jgi:chaperone required for assembly of F1-ATPase
MLASPQLLAALSTTTGVAISGVITIFIAKKTILASERNVKLAILDR